MFKITAELSGIQVRLSSIMTQRWDLVGTVFGEVLRASMWDQLQQKNESHVHQTGSWMCLSPHYRIWWMRVWLHEQMMYMYKDRKHTTEIQPVFHSAPGAMWELFVLDQETLFSNILHATKKKVLN